MGVSDVVAAVAQSISQARSPLTAREAYLLYVLQGMPLYRDIHRLDLWEHAYNQLAPESGLTETEKLINAMYEVGADCLYAAYSESSARGEYVHHALPLLLAAHINVPNSPDFSDW